MTRLSSALIVDSGDELNVDRLPRWTNKLLRPLDECSSTCNGFKGSGAAFCEKLGGLLL
jgi:hypothetical protein